MKTAWNGMNGRGTATNDALPDDLNTLTLYAYEVMRPIGDAARWEVWTADCSAKIGAGTAGNLATARDCAIAAAEAEFSRRLNLERSTP